MNNYLIKVETLENSKPDPNYLFQSRQRMDEMKKKKYGLIEELLKNSAETIREIDIEDALGADSQDHYDVFLSYSHDDLDYCAALYDVLTSRGLSVFADYLYWGNIDDFLQSWFDHEKSPEKNTVSCDKYQKMCASAYVILETMLTKEITNSDSVCFMQPKSKKSIFTEASSSYDTFSPWVYHELFTAKTQEKLLEESFQRHTNFARKVEFRVNLGSFVEITGQKWQKIQDLEKSVSSKQPILSILNEK